MLSLDTSNPAFLALATQVLQEAAAAHFAAQPKPDPAFTTAQAAEVLGTTAETICDYLKLPATHPRHLPHVRITDSLSGRRVLLSDLTAWQQRNRHVNEPAPQLMDLLKHHRPARRRRATA